MVEFWTGMGNAQPRDIAETAARAEAEGWDGMVVYDSQCIFGEAFVMMTAAAMATERLQLSLSTSNPVLRHPSVAASAVATVQELAGDRIRFGIGRGDSSLANVGGAPAPVAMFERYVDAVRRYLRGEAVSFDAIADWQLTDDVSTIRLAHVPESSRLGWLTGRTEPVPVDVYATGPRVLGVAGRSADGVVLSVGADADRIAWAMDVARREREASGLDPDSLEVTAVCVLGVSDDLAHAVAVRRQHRGRHGPVRRDQRNRGGTGLRRAACRLRRDRPFVRHEHARRVRHAGRRADRRVR